MARAVAGVVAVAVEVSVVRVVAKAVAMMVARVFARAVVVGSSFLNNY